jgi:hypothetical protein
MVIYQPYIHSNDRVVWHGGESTQLHYEIQVWDVSQIRAPYWKEISVCTPMDFPTDVKQIYEKIREYYDSCSSARHDNMLDTL